MSRSGINEIGVYITEMLNRVPVQLRLCPLITSQGWRTVVQAQLPQACLLIARLEQLLIEHGVHVFVVSVGATCGYGLNARVHKIGNVRILPGEDTRRRARITPNGMVDLRRYFIAW